MIEHANIQGILLPKYIVKKEKEDNFKEYKRNNFPKMINIPKTHKIKMYELSGGNYNL